MVEIEPDRWVLPLAGGWLLEVLVVFGETFAFIRDPDGELVEEVDVRARRITPAG